MKEIYKKIWSLAKEFYKRGRPMDIEHIEWMMKEAEIVCKKEKIDDSLLIPLVILHDVGYAEVSSNNYFNQDTRKAHMKEGSFIAKQILEKVGYPQDKTEMIVGYVAVHDNWALNDDSVFKDKILGVFNDLDFIWTVSPKGFPALKKVMNKSSPELIKWAETNDKLVKRPFFTITTKKLFEKYLLERKSSL